MNTALLFVTCITKPLLSVITKQRYESRLENVGIGNYEN